MSKEKAVFCRILLSGTMERVRKHFTPETIKNAWAYVYGRGSAEFQINKCPEVPNGYYVTVRGSTITEAKIEGWNKFMTSRGIDDAEESEN